MYNKLLPIHLVAFIGLLCLCACQGRGVAKLPLLSGHRGADYIAPENTLASADSCIKYGVEFMECDICISKDSVFYLLHDSLLDRTTNGCGNIADWMSVDIDTLDAGAWFGAEFKGQCVPRLADVLKKAKQHHMGVTIDYQTGDLAKLIELIRAEGMMEHCTFTFSDESAAKEFRRLVPDKKVLQCYVRKMVDYERVITELRPDIVVVQLDSLTPDFVSKCHLAGLKVLALALGDRDFEADGRKSVALGVDVLATDRPEYYRKEFRLQ